MADSGVRLVSFDRPGYGGSTPAPFGLASIATDAHAVAESDDKLAPPEYGRYLAQHLPHARPVMRDGEGHLGLFEHLGEILDELTRPGAAPG